MIFGEVALQGVHRRVWILVYYWTCSLTTFTDPKCGNCRLVSIWTLYTFNFCSLRKSASCLWLNVWSVVWNKWGFMCPWFIRTNYHSTQYISPTKKYTSWKIISSVYKMLCRSQVQWSVRILLFLCTVEGRRIKAGRKLVLGEVWMLIWIASVIGLGTSKRLEKHS